MGINTDYFAASSDEMAASVLDGGPAEASAGFATVELKNVDPTVVMGLLESLLTGQDYDSVLDNPRQGEVLAAADDGVMVVALTDELRDALATSDESRLSVVGAELAATEELDASDAEDVAAVIGGVRELAALARSAQARGEGLYCWVCL